MEMSATGGGICGWSSSSPLSSESVVTSEEKPEPRDGELAPARAFLDHSSRFIASTTSSLSSLSGVRSSGMAAPTGSPRMCPSAITASSVAVPSTSPK